MKKNLIPYAITGMGIGFPVTLICMMTIGGFNAVVAEFLTWLVASALFGILSGVIFDKNSDLILPAAIALHCLGCLAVAVTAGWICGYADSFLELLMGILPVFLIVYVLIYLFSFLSMKRYEKKINQELNQK